MQSNLNDLIKTCNIILYEILFPFFFVIPMCQKNGEVWLGNCTLIAVQNE